jgi:phosphatidylserine decarboxylase
MARIPIAKEGLPYIIGASVLLLGCILLGWTFFAGLALIITLLVINFFRDPERTSPQIPHSVVAPADGLVVFVGKAATGRFLDKEAIKISIFMSIFDVHVNRVPFPGEVENVHYEKGKFFSANLDKASTDNEHNAVILRIPGDEKIVFVQIAGLVARRISCWLRPGDVVRRGERFGLIRFGSRVDLYVPQESHLAVKEGQRVKAGESIVCYYPRNRIGETTKNPGR